MTDGTSQVLENLRAEVEELRARCDEQDAILAKLRESWESPDPAKLVWVLSARLAEHVIELRTLLEELRRLGEFWTRQVFVKAMSDALDEMDRDAARRRFASARIRERYFRKGMAANGGADKESQL